MDIILDKILYMNMAACGLILAVILVRVLLQKAPKYIRCILWAIVAIRLVCPFSIESEFSLVPDISVTDTQEREDNDISRPSYENEEPTDIEINVVPDDNSQTNEVYEPDVDIDVDEQNTEIIDAHKSINIDAKSIFSIIWILGIVVILVHSIISYIRLKKRVSTATNSSDNIWVSDDVETPFILGMIKPRIFLPSEMDAEIKKYVLSHEHAHISRKDHIWKPLGFVITCVHWFNPLVWVAYVLFSRDVEMACDEKVIKNLDVEERKAYSKALLACSTSNKPETDCPVAFSEVAVKSRVKSVLNYKKPAFWVVVVALLVCVAMAVTFLTSSKSNENNNDAQQSATEIDAGKSFKSEDLGVNLEVSDVSATGLTLKCSLGNAEHGMYSASDEYWLERYENDTWIEVDKSEMVAFSDVLPFENEKEWKIDWSDLYGELDAGKYRVAKPIWFSRNILSSSFGDEYIFVQEFIVSQDMVSKGSAIEASRRLDVIVSYNEDGSPTYPDEYAGCYIAGAKLIILLTDTSEDMVKKYTDIVGNCSDYIEIKKAEYSYNYLYSEAHRLAQLIIDNNMSWYTCGVSQTNNSIVFGVAEEDYEAIIEFLDYEGGNLPIEVSSMPSGPVTVQK